MNQQTLMKALSAYPAPKASDEFLWLHLSQAWQDEEAAPRGNVQELSDDDVSYAVSLMHMNTEKMLSITKFSWVAN